MTRPPSWPDLTSTLIAGEDLDVEAARWAMTQVMAGSASPVQLAGFLVALRSKGETVEEMLGLSQAMIDHAVPYPDLEHSQTALDIVGTGGDRLHTVNISTMAAVVIASCGVPIVKHGNRASSSSSGSADVLEALGLPLDHTPQDVAAIGRSVGITFCFAQTFHPSMRHAAVARKELRIATAFNFLGPITNPGLPRSSAVGVADASMAPIIAGVFARRGRQALVFRGARGLDEFAAIGPVDMWEVRDADVVHEVIDPVKDMGMSPITVDDLRGGTAQENAEVARALFQGATGPVRDTVLANAAAGIVADGRLVGSGTLAQRLSAGMEIAAQAVDSGATQRLLDAWRDAATKGEAKRSDR
ncbi:anthranilate phosphoribosyltransferase [Jonesia quinghaiensis]|uniref:anthranilate phosphoribosyltransferase n=1 Tax=Jonesia quinghaiensis TaxID=262806 RepID=UPI000413F6FF|nr:anthranilate phosphoribosyltransferase [Jonesia quinghaiensis]